MSGHSTVRIQGFVNHAEIRTQRYSLASMEDVLQEVQNLENQQLYKSRFRRLTCRLEPLIDFFIRYSPAIDMMVQYEVAPSALIWGVLKALLEIARASVHYFRRIADSITRLGDIISISSQYETILIDDVRVQDSLKCLFLKIFRFLQKIKSTLRKSVIKIFLQTIFRSFDAEFGDDLRLVSQSHKKFDAEVTLSFRRKIHTDLLYRQNQERAELLNSITMWLNRVPYWERFQRALAKRTPGTGRWLLTNQVFQEWSNGTLIKQNPSRIWLLGAPGSGKTVLSAIVIEHLLQIRLDPSSNKPLVAYFHCSSDDKRTSLADIYSSILSQILAQLETVPPTILSAYHSAKAYGHSVVSSVDNLMPMIHEVIKSLPALYLIIDALDECVDVSETTNKILTAAKSLPSLHLMFFSRDVPSIRMHLKDIPMIRMDAVLTRQDIDLYLKEAVEALACSGHEMKDRVFAEISEKSNGMFLFANLSIRTLQMAINLEDMAEQLIRIPNGLANFYQQILESINRTSPARQNLARTVFLWICGSVRPLTWDELRCALSWDPDRGMICESRAPFKNAILELCCPLVEYQSETATFRFAHHSVHEYLVNIDDCECPASQLHNFKMSTETIHREIARVTLSYLAWDQIAEQININSYQYPLSRYATENWCHHLSLSGHAEMLYLLYSEFVASPKRRLTWIARFLISEELPFPLQKIVGLQKLVNVWCTDVVSYPNSPIKDLIDVQMALFRLDELAKLDGASFVRKISNFERSIIVRDLAREYTMAGQLEEGIQMFETALLESLNPDSTPSLESCWILNSLGILYDQQGKTEAAEQAQRKALECQVRMLPQDHLDLIITINELGRISRHLGRLKEAETFHRRALNTLNNLFPATDLHISWTKNALGRCLLRQGRPSEAAELHEQNLAVEIELLGKDHPHPIWIMSDLARCYRDQGRIQNAIDMQKEVMERRTKILGPQHPDTLWAMNSLGLLYALSGDNEKANDLHAIALEGQKLVLGENHAHTIWSKNILKVA